MGVECRCDERLQTKTKKFTRKKREVQRRLTYEYRCDERLKTKKEESTRLLDTGIVVIYYESIEVFGYRSLVVELEHVKIKKVKFYYESR